MFCPPAWFCRPCGTVFSNTASCSFDVTLVTDGFLHCPAAQPSEGLSLRMAALDPVPISAALPVPSAVPGSGRATPGRWVSGAGQDGGREWGVRGRAGPNGGGGRG